MRQLGRLEKWDDAKGFGFIQPASGGPRVFVHISAFRDRSRRPKVGDQLSFEVARDLQNRLSAGTVHYGSGPARRPDSERSAWPAALVAILTIGAITVAAVYGYLPLFLPAVYVVVSLGVFLAYAFDKSAAMNRRQRMPENTLHLANLLGGWPGGLVAARLFHHKSKKLEFRVAFYACIALNCAALAWLAIARPF
jgi:uncharacterized membrane protein YsdA (DUF1294 family)/cold shock CspA family protein